MDGMIAMTPLAGAPVIDRDKLEMLTQMVGAGTVSAMLAMVPDSVQAELTRIEGSLGRGDVEDARRASHVLKGVAANLGLLRLTAAATALDRQLRDGPSDAAAVAQAVTDLQAAANETLIAVATV